MARLPSPAPPAATGTSPAIESRSSSAVVEARPIPFDGPCQTLVIGCGNLLRGDDAVGPVLIRHLWELGLPPGVRCADAGTGGMDVAFQMRGVSEVILIDACQSGSEPGSVFELPGSEVEQLPPLEGLHSHAFRWDHALAFARWLLKDEYPERITVYLIEAATLDIGAPLSPAVERAMQGLARRLRSRWGVAPDA
ncbi:MAG: hydrogenase maturation protease [Holophagales bacterium]|nr:hydrogenase maturation protease [Holophagales bacterium]